MKAGLIEADAVKEGMKLGDVVDAYLKRRTDIKPASLVALNQSVENLKSFFGPDKPIASIHAGDAEDFKRWLTTEARINRRQRKKVPGLSLPTVAKRLQGAVTIFRDAIRRELISKNPFVDVKKPKNKNPDRQEYIPAATIERLIDLAPSSEWKLLLAMSRYLGVRVPSEPFSMTWDCVDWERQQLRVPSPKTEVHGKSFRIVPILDEVRPHLERVFDEAADGSSHIFEGLRQRDSVKKADLGFWTGVNLRQPLIRMLKWAGIKPWPRLWHNLRASAQTDLANRVPIHVACDWLGNSRIVAQNHYLQTADAHFEAVPGSAQKTAHQPSEVVGNQSKWEKAFPAELSISPGISNDCDIVHKSKVGVEGFEPPTSSV